MDTELQLQERDKAGTIAPRLLDWFEQEGRKDLPWKHPPTPYRVWVSEIMLQQTQVATVIPYYASFMQRFPDIATLAAAPLDDVLHQWSGLGYYARARNLHRAAQAIMTRHGGQFPQTLEEVQALPGVGRSTAGAILALAFGQRHPILDGNVKRVLCRHFGVEGFPNAPAVERRLWALADACTPAARASEYTQAIMDLGATICTRTRTACLLCPLQSDCIARCENRQDRLPEARPTRKRPQREAWVVIATSGRHKVLLEQRPPSGLWGGMWVLPEFPTRAHAEQWCGEHLAGSEAARRGEPLRHAFSHFDYQMQPLLVSCRGMSAALRDDDRYRWYDVRTPARVGLPKPVATLIRNATDPHGKDGT